MPLQRESNYKAESWGLCLGKISTQVFLSNDSKRWLGTSKYFWFFSPASRTRDKEIKYVNFIFISMIKWHIYWLFIMLPLLLWTEPIEFPLALKKPRNWNRNVDTALLYKLSDSYCKKGTVIKSTASPCEYRRWFRYSFSFTCGSVADENH